MKIIHILNELKFSGAEIMYVAAAGEFHQLGCELYVVNTAPQLGEYAPYFENAGYKVIHWIYPKSIILKSKFYIKFILFLKKEQCEVVHIHSFDKLLGLSFCAFVTRCKSIYTIHNVINSHWYSYPYHYLIRLTAKKIFKCKFQSISDSVYNHEKRYYHTNSIKIYNWYDSNRFYPARKNEKSLIRKNLGIEENSLVIISIGGCSPIKRHTDIIKALPKIIEKYPQTVYIHLGAGSSIDEEMQLTKKLNIDSHIFFYGNQPDVRQYLIASDIYLMPSKFEGISITTIEALACKIPAILYNVPGLRDFNNEKVCAEIIEENYNLLAIKTINLFSDLARQNSIIENGYNYVNQKFDLKTNSKKIFELYKL